MRNAESLQIRITNKGKPKMTFEEVAKAVDEILKHPMSGKGVLTVGELIADRIMGMARHSLETEHNPAVTNLTTERKKRGRKSNAQKMMEAAVAPLDVTPAPDESDLPF